MYKVNSITEYDCTTFFVVTDNKGNQFEAFDYSPNADYRNGTPFEYEIGKAYDMKFSLFGNIVDESTNDQPGTKISFNVLGDEIIGRNEYFVIETKNGVFRLKKKEKTKFISESNTGYMIYTRIDLIQLGDKIHPDLL